MSAVGNRHLFPVILIVSLVPHTGCGSTYRPVCSDQAVLLVSEMAFSIGELQKA